MLTEDEKSSLTELWRRAEARKAEVAVSDVGITDEPLPIQMILGSITDGYVAHLESSLELAEESHGHSSDWQATLKAGRLALKLLRNFEAEFGEGCLVDIEKWLKVSSTDVIGHDVIANARVFAANQNGIRREDVVSFKLWA